MQIQPPHTPNTASLPSPLPTRSFMIARGTDECGIEDDLVAGKA
jgi:hypothetical protein